MTRLDEKSASHILGSLLIPKITVIAENGNLSMSIDRETEASWQWDRIIQGESAWIKSAKRIISRYQERFSFISSQYLSASINITLMMKESEMEREIVDSMVEELRESTSGDSKSSEDIDILMFGDTLIIKDKKLNMANCIHSYIKS